MKPGRRASFEPVFRTKITESPPIKTPTARDRTTHRIVNIGHVLQLFLARATGSGPPPSEGEDVRSPGGAALPQRQLSSRPPRGRGGGKIRSSRAPAPARRGGRSSPTPAHRPGLVRIPQPYGQ